MPCSKLASNYFATVSPLPHLFIVDTGNLTRMSVESMGAREKARFELVLSLIKWEPLYKLDSCNEKYVYYQTVIGKLIEICLPSKVVTRHTGDRPWITDGYRLLIRKRQRAHNIMRGNMVEARSLCNQVNLATAKLKLSSTIHALKQCMNRE